MIGLYVGGLLIAGLFAFMPGGCLTNGCFTERGGCCSTLLAQPANATVQHVKWTQIAVGLLPLLRLVAGYFSAGSAPT